MTERAHTVSFKKQVVSRSEANTFLQAAGDFVIVEREVPRLLILRCPCGCGDDLLINLDKRSGPAWRHYEKKAGHSLYPSYWRDSACGSHFIVWNSKVYWCYGTEDVDDNWNASTDIEDRILALLDKENYIHYIDLADECGLIPWECFQACKQLMEKDKCVMGQGPFKYHFKLPD